MPLYDQALTRILPNGESAYVALLTHAPGVDGTGEVEASYAGYARIDHTDWAAHTNTGGWYLSNTGTIVFPAVTGSSITVRAWGIYLAEKPDLIASGLMLNSFGYPAPQFLAVGDQARFLDNALQIRTGT